MSNYYLYILIILLIIYLYTVYYNSANNEGFLQTDYSNIEDSVYYNTRRDVIDIYDEFYVFLYDIIFDSNNNLYVNMYKIFNDYSTSVYNNHLIIGMKHGGFLLVNMTTQNQSNIKCKSVMNTNAIVSRCQFNYPKVSRNFLLGNPIQSPFLFDQHEFTQISIIDNEIYYLTQDKVIELLTNCYDWLVHKGYLFIEVYNSLKNMEDDLVISHKDIGNYIYTSYIQHQDSDVILKETINQKYKFRGKQRVNFHSLTYHNIDYIHHICSSFHFQHKNTIPISTNKSIMIFQKEM